MRHPFIIQAFATSLTVLTLSAGCSTQDTTIGSSSNQKQARDRQITAIPEPMPNTRSENDQLVQREEESAVTLHDSLQSESEAKGKAISNGALSENAVASDAPAIRAIVKPKRHALQQIQDASHQVIDTTTSAANTEKYQQLNSNPVIRVAEQSTSTFSIDVDTGAYANMRRFLNSGQLPPANAIRVEELLNYFNYDYPTPDIEKQPFSINTELSSNPWNEKTRLLHIGLKGYTVDTDSRPAANLVFLIDVSGSMSDANKLGLLKSSINMLSKDLGEKDSVSIVVYAGASGVVLEPTAGNQSRTIARALDKLSAGGSTNGEAGIELAYAMAEKQMTKDSINRIILATDGDFNVGINDIDTLKKLIERKRESGIALTTLGFGSGNYNDHLMEQLANVGNGNYAYIDTLNEARKVLSEELNSTLLTIAKDVKIQIEFNPAQVSEYRLLGYVNRALANEDFSNDTVDAGEIGAGHTVTALYEVALVGEGGERHSASRYEKLEPANTLASEIAEVRLRYKQADENTSKLLTRIVERNSLLSNIDEASDNYRFSAAVAGFSQLLLQSKYVAEFSYDEAAELASTAKGRDRFGYRNEFVQLIDLANELDQLRQARLRVMEGSEQDGSAG